VTAATVVAAQAEGWTIAGWASFSFRYNIAMISYHIEEDNVNGNPESVQFCGNDLLRWLIEESVQFYGNDLLRWLIEDVDVVPDDHSLARVNGVAPVQPPRLEQAP